LDIHSAEDWNRVTQRDIIALKGGRLLRRLGGMQNTLSHFYPQGAPQLVVTKEKSQTTVTQVIKKLFPDDEILLRYKHPSMKYSASGKLMELDLFIPSRALAIEYQGRFHYEYTTLSGTPHEAKKKDEEKERVAKELGITLIEIPHWWDRKKSSIVATVHKFRPDLVKDPGKGVPIPESPPEPKWKRKNFNNK
jgi:hypothetical protein